MCKLLINKMERETGFELATFALAILNDHFSEGLELRTVSPFAGEITLTVGEMPPTTGISDNDCKFLIFRNQQE